MSNKHLTRTIQFRIFIDHLKDANNAINTFYPSGWVIFFLIFGFFLLKIPIVHTALASFHENYLWFISLNKSPPYSTSIAKAYFVIVLLATPLQIISLCLVKRKYFFSSSFPGVEKSGVSAAIFFAMIWFALIFFISIGTSSMTRLLGSGELAVYVMTPLINGLLPASISILVNMNRNQET